MKINILIENQTIADKKMRKHECQADQQSGREYAQSNHIKESGNIKFKF